MNKKLIILSILFINISIFCLMVLFYGCRKEHVAPVNRLVKDLFCFKTGSEWTYYDSVSQTTQKMVITNYEIRQFAPEPMGRKKTSDFAESIYIDFSVENTILSLFIKGRTWLKADIDRDNTLDGMHIATPAIKNTSSCREFSIRCDENNNFRPTVTYLSNYTVNDTNYSDVYVFTVPEYETTYYVSKHVGFIRCVLLGPFGFDLVLIDKNIQQ
jgi:hypothetical protein